MSEKAKPCPFCGGTDLEYQAGKLAVICIACAAEGPFGGLRPGTMPRKIAAKKWNHRTGGWVAVKKQQPDCEINVLVTSAEWRFEPVRVAFWDGEFWFTPDANPVDPTHWQPLPEPPETESEVA